MDGFVASSSERYTGPVELSVSVAAADSEAAGLVESRTQAFLKALDAGFFFPGMQRNTDVNVPVGDAGALAVRLDVVDLPRTAFDVLSGLLLDCVYRDVFSFRSARAILRDEVRDLLRETHRRPAAVARPPFAVELPTDADLGNNTLLVEIEFSDVVPSRIGDQLLEQLELLEVLWLAYPIEEGEPVESLGAQRHFNDPRTIHHHEWAWEADPVSWNLLVNLCCAWSRTIPVARLHVE
jgi:hypothetical protein